MEQRLHLGEAHQWRASGFAIGHHWWCLVANQVCDGEAHGHVIRTRRHNATAAQAIVHPRATAFCPWARIRVKEERGDGVACLQRHYVEEPHIGMPDVSLAVRGNNTHAEDAAGRLEHARQHPGQREIRPDEIVVEPKLGLLLPLSPKCHVPQLQRVTLKALVHRKSAQALQLFLGLREALVAQALQQVDDLFRTAGHLAGNAHLRVVAVAEQRGLLPTLREDLFDDRRVVAVTRRRDRHEFAVQLLAQCPAPTVLHEREERCLVQREAPRASLGGGTVAGCCCCRSENP
mmetsp:Transcript_43000/g.102947  ORF Transcript_43000/g.102947 Transcript_43000/m.102947 type:complete len:290 (-) Transcript_43000:222-1091(-)